MQSFHIGGSCSLFWVSFYPGMIYTTADTESSNVMKLHCSIDMLRLYFHVQYIHQSMHWSLSIRSRRALASLVRQNRFITCPRQYRHLNLGEQSRAKCVSDTFSSLLFQILAVEWSEGWCPISMTSTQWNAHPNPHLQATMTMSNTFFP